MKRIVVQLILALLCLSAQAQKVSNIRAEQRGQDIVVLYSLETSSPCEVSLLLSQDNGTNWSSPLKNVSGDVGKNISAGEKQITWKVLEELEQLVGNQIQFKVTSQVVTRIFECSAIEYIGNMDQLYDLCFQEFNCPQSVLESMQKDGKGGFFTITVEFDIDNEGTPNNFKVAKCPLESNELKEEALRVCEVIFPATRWRSGLCRELGSLTTPEVHSNQNGYYNIEFFVFPKVD